MKNKITKKSTIRDVMQILGTNLLREGFNNNIHVAATLGSIKENEKIIITDVRFGNEAKAVKDRGGIMIRVQRDDYIFDKSGKRIIPSKEYVNLNSNQHESETALDSYEDWDYIIDNNSTIEDLVVKVKEILLKERLL